MEHNLFLGKLNIPLNHQHLDEHRSLIVAELDKFLDIETPNSSSPRNLTPSAEPQKADRAIPS